ncbi:MAG TPA: hypothetical protein VLA09_06120 [Longimicrobiales bacterium]|nr:hypothetical protein [Longimicrobiales bacterium]
MTERTPQNRWQAPAAASLAALLVGLAGCGDDPFSFNWNDAPDTVQLYSLARPELNLLSGFSFFDRTAVLVEAPGTAGTWDVAVDTRGQELVLLPPGALGITARAAIGVLGTVNFDDVTEAPEDTLLYEPEEPVSLSNGTVYVVRTNRRPGSFGSSCVYYAKMEPVTIDVPGGVLTFRYVSSPICNSRDLVPPNR